MPQFTEFTFPSSNGRTNIRVRKFVPDSAPRGVVQIAHGVAEHCERYDAFMKFLSENGFVAAANDHLGHGKSITDESELGFFAEKVKSGKEKFAQMKKQYADQPHTEQTDLCYKELEEGINMLSEGLGCPNKFIADKNNELLDKGLEVIYEGAEKMTYAQSVSAASGA